MEDKPLKVRTLRGPPHPVSPQTHPRSNLGPWLSSRSALAPGSPQQSPRPTESWPWQGSGSPPPACSSSPPNSPRPSASLVVCGPQALDKSSGHRASGKSSQQDIRNLWTTATLSQPKLNVALSDVCEDSEGSSVSSRTRRWRKQTAGHDWDASWEALEDRKDKDSFKQEELDEHSLLELEMRLDSSVGSHVEDDDESRTGQCGLTGRWAPSAQGPGQGLNLCCCKMRGSCRIRFSRIPWEGFITSAHLANFKSTGHSWSAPYRAGVIQWSVVWRDAPKNWQRLRARTRAFNGITGRVERRELIPCLWI